MTCPWEPGRRLGPGGQQSLHSSGGEGARHSGASRAGAWVGPQPGCGPRDLFGVRTDSLCLRGTGWGSGGTGATTDLRLGDAEDEAPGAERPAGTGEPCDVTSLRRRYTRGVGQEARRQGRGHPEEAEGVEVSVPGEMVVTWKQTGLGEPTRHTAPPLEWMDRGGEENS